MSGEVLTKVIEPLRNFITERKQNHYKRKVVEMKMLKSKEELIKNLSPIIEKVQHDKKNMKRIIDGLDEYALNAAHVKRIMNNFEEESQTIDMRLLCLLTEQIYIVSKDPKVKFDEYFTEKEIKRSRRYNYRVVENIEQTIDFPLVIENVTKIHDDHYYTHIDTKILVEWFNNGLLDWNPETQREVKKEKRATGIIEKPNINTASVDQIAELALKGELEITKIVLNALPGTSDDDEELVYDARKRKLVITEGTELDILDGMHRLAGARKAYEKNPNLDHIFELVIKNSDEVPAKRYFAQISKVNPVSKTHIENMESKDFSSLVIDQLRKGSDLKGRISQTDKIRKTLNELVSYDVLSKSINDTFEIKNRMQAKEVGEYLVEFFDYLLGYYHDEFNDNYNEVNKESLFNENIMFAGYITLAKRMKDNDIELRKIPNILDEIDFSRNNKQWKELSIIEGRSVSKKNIEYVINYFNELDIKETIIN